MPAALAALDLDLLVGVARGPGSGHPRNNAVCLVDVGAIPGSPKRRKGCPGIIEANDVVMRQARALSKQRNFRTTLFELATSLCSAHPPTRSSMLLSSSISSNTVLSQPDLFPLRSIHTSSSAPLFVGPQSHKIEKRQFSLQASAAEANKTESKGCNQDKPKLQTTAHSRRAKVLIS